MIFRKVKNILEASLEVLVTVAMVVLVLDVVWGVFTRFVLGHQSAWTEELARFLMIWVGLLGASVALNRGAHLGIDYFVGKLSSNKRVHTELFAFLCVALFSFSVLFIGGSRLVHSTLVTNQISPALGVKMGYVYFAVPISGFFLTLYSVEFFIEKLMGHIKGKEVEGPAESDSAAGID